GWCSRGQSLARTGGDAGARCVRLEAAAATTAALPAEVVDREVAELARVSGRAPVEPAVEDEPAPDAGGDREVHEIADLPAAPGAVPELGQCSRRRVVLDDRRAVEGLLDYRYQRDVVPAREVRRRLDHAFEGVERTAARDANRSDALPGDRGHVDRAAAELDLAGNDGRRTIRDPGRNRQPAEDAPVSPNDSGRQLGATDVERQHGAGIGLRASQLGGAARTLVCRCCHGLVPCAAWEAA